MSGELRLYTYGRCVVRGVWYINETIPANRLYYVHDGAAEFLQGGTAYPLTAGNLYFFAQNLDFRVRAAENQAFDHTYYDFFMAPPMVCQTYRRIGIEQNPALQEALGLLLFFAQARARQDAACDYESAALSHLSTCMYLIEQGESLERVDNQAVSDTISYIHEHFAQTLPIARLAAQVNLAPDYLSRLFKKHMGIPPHRYLRQYRLAMAEKMLLGGATVKQAAAEVGYETAASLSEAMKKSRGIYPTEFIAQRIKK